MVQSVRAQALQLGHPLPPQDLLHGGAALPNARRAAWTQRAARCGYEWTGDTGGDPDHVLKNTIIHGVYLVVDVKPVRAAGEDVDQTSPAGFWLLGLGHQLLHKTKRYSLEVTHFESLYWISQRGIKIVIWYIQ